MTRIATLGAGLIIAAAAGALAESNYVGEPDIYDPHRVKPLRKRTGKSYKNSYGRKPRRLREKEGE